MRLLLIVDDCTDSRAVSDYVAWRFGSRVIQVDVLHILGPAPARRPEGAAGALGALVSLPRPASAKSGRVAPAPADDLAYETACRLREAHGARILVGSVHARRGDPARVIAESSQRLGSDLVLVQRPSLRGRDWLRAIALVRRLLGRVDCAVELFNPALPQAGGAFELLAPLGLEDLVQFPVTRLCEFSWPQTTRLRVLGLLPEAEHESALEHNGLRFLRGPITAHGVRRAAATRLDAFCDELGRVFGTDVALDHELATGGACAALDAALVHPAVSLMLVLDEQARGPVSLRPLAREQALALALRTNGSALLLRGDRGDLALRQWLAETATSPQLRRAGPRPQ